MTKSILWRKEFLLMYRLWSIIEEDQDRSSNPEPGRRNGSKTTEEVCFYWLFPSLTFSYLPYKDPRSTCLRRAPSTANWILLYQLAVKKMAHIHAHRSMGWRQFSPENVSSKLTMTYANEVVLKIKTSPSPGIWYQARYNSIHKTGGVAHQLNTCLTCPVSWVPPPIPQSISNENPDMPDRRMAHFSMVV